MVTDADRANLVAYVRSRGLRLISPSRCTPEQDTAYNNALSDIERQLQEERLVPARATPTQHSTAMITDADRANLRAYVRSRAQRVKNPS
jgi:mono/diheme cytochrome c family protein